MGIGQFHILWATEPPEFPNIFYGSDFPGADTPDGFLLVKEYPLSPRNQPHTSAAPIDPGQQATTACRVLHYTPTSHLTPPAGPIKYAEYPTCGASQAPTSFSPTFWYKGRGVAELAQTP